jgi:hypothetical protein
MHGLYWTMYINTFSTVHIPHIFPGADMGRLHVFMTRHIQYTHINKPVFSTLLRTLRATLYSPLEIKCISSRIQVAARSTVYLKSACLILKSIGFPLNSPFSHFDCQKVVTRLRYVLSSPHPLPFMDCQALSIPHELSLAALPSPLLECQSPHPIPVSPFGSLSCPLPHFLDYQMLPPFFNPLLAFPRLLEHRPSAFIFPLNSPSSLLDI